MTCKHCSKEIADDSIFCEHCGKQVNYDSVEKQTKSSMKVDIRWVLLPMMILATGALWLTNESYILIDGGHTHYSEFVFVVPLLLFIIAIWFRIKNVVPPSFLIIIGILLIVDFEMLYEAHNTNNVYRPSINVDYRMNNSHKVYSITIMGEYDYYMDDENDEANRLQRCAQAVENTLKKEKLNDIHQNSLYKEGKHYPHGAHWIQEVGLILLGVYLIYAIIAYKKKWNF